MVITHCNPDGVKPRPRWIDGRATLTMVASRTTMDCATHAMTSTSHGPLSPVSARLRLSTGSSSLGTRGVKGGCFCGS